MNQTRDQQRAASAWKHVNEKLPDDYVQVVKGTSVTILTSGLGQTVAFYLAKDENKQRTAYYHVLKHIAEWVLRDKDVETTPKGLLDAITTGTSDHYRALTTETLAYLDWLKRFAEAKANKTAANPA